MKSTLVLAVLGVIVLGGCGDGVEGPVDIDSALGQKPVPAEPDIDRGLVCWWKFDEASGGKAVDSSGKGHDGTLQGGLSFDAGSVEGRAGKALNFGEDQHIQVNGYKGIIGTHPRTVAAWIKTERDNGWILNWGGEEGGEMFMFGFIRGRRRIGITPKGGYLYMNDRTSDNQWHHVAAVVEKAELPNLYDNAKVYLDGSEAEIHDIGLLGLWPIDTVRGQDVVIGKGYAGALDDVRIYDRPLSEQEIGLLFKLAP
jgi:hypothetical protein